MAIDPEACRLTFASGAHLELEVEADPWGDCPLSLSWSAASGRYVQVATGQHEGDYIYQDYVFVDLETESVLEGFELGVPGEIRHERHDEHDLILVGDKLYLFDPEPRIVPVSSTAIFLPR